MRTDTVDAPGSTISLWPNRTTVALIAVGLLLVGCGAEVVVDPPPTGDPVASAVTAVSGDGQSGVAGQALGSNLIVKVTTASGAGVPGATVGWTVTGGGGTLSSARTTTDDQGEASVTWTLGEAAGANNNTATASVSGLSGSPVTFTASADPDAAARIALVSGNGQTGIPGSALAQALVVVVLDRFDNPVPEATVSWDVTGGGGTLSSSSNTTDDRGRASAVWTLGSEVGTDNNTATASATGLAGSPVTFTASGTSSSMTILFEESFEDTDYGSRGWYDLSTPVNTTSEQRTGIAALELEFATGAVDAGRDLGRHKFTDTPTVYLSYWVKYSPNWQGSGRGSHPHEFFLFTNMDGDYVGPVGSTIELLVESHHNTTTGMTMRVIVGPDGHPDLRLMETAVLFTDAQGAGFKGDYHHIEVEITMNSAVDAADGIIRLWFDNALALEVDDVVMKTRPGENGMMFNQLLIAPYIGVGSPVNQFMWVDDLAVGTARQ